MPDQPPRPVDVSFFWSTILHSAFAGLPTAGVYQAIRAVMGRQGVTWRGNPVMGVNRMRSIANRIVRATSTFSQAPGTAAIDESMIAPWVSYDPLTAGVVPSSFDIRWEHIVIRDGQQVSEWRTLVDFPGPFSTKADLLDQLNIYGSLTAGRYKAQHVGVGRVSIIRVRG